MHCSNQLDNFGILQIGPMQIEILETFIIQQLETLGQNTDEKTKRVFQCQVEGGKTSCPVRAT
jgi:hypothetical protein